MRALKPVVCCLAAIASLALGAAPAAATDPVTFHPTNLEVYEGEETWHTSNTFHLNWRNPWSSTYPYVPLAAAVHYRVRNGKGAIVIGDTRMAGSVEWMDLSVPNVPDRYTVEIWDEDSTGFQGTAVTATLPFDDERPGPVSPSPPAEWIDLNAIPYPVHLGQPAGTPLSGIAGYAVSVDSSPAGDPCAAADRCLDSELDLHGGLDENTILLPELREGTSYMHAVAVSGSGMKSSTTATVALHVDRTLPTTRLWGAPSGWSNRPVALTATAADALSGMRADGPSGPFTAIRIDGGVPTTASGDSASATVIDEGVHEVAYYARDAAGNVDDGGASNGLPNPLPATVVVRIDRVDPKVSFVNAQDPADPETIEARVADGLSGADPSRGRISVRRAGSGEEFEALPTEASGGRLRARWDSDSYPAGEYEFRATGYDAAGNAVTADRRANGSLMLLPNPLKAPTAMRAGFGGRTLVRRRCTRRAGRRRCRLERIAPLDRRPMSMAVPYGRGGTFTGQLVAGAGSPLGGLPVQVIEQFEPGSQPSQRVTTVQTGADGVFTLRLEPGPSRSVTAVFGGTRTLTRSSAGPDRLGVSAEVRMRASSPVATIGGRPVVFRGEVLADGAAIPPDGKSVQLQFRAPGVPWTEFRTVQTDRRGRFEYAYRFADDDSRGIPFQFRAVAPTQSDWPYEPGGSRPVAVRGR